MKARLFIFLILTGVLLKAQTPVPESPGVYPMVYTLAKDDNHIYIGGMTSVVGENTKNSFILDKNTGNINETNPLINMLVNDAVKDADGAIYIGGAFTLVDDEPLEGLIKMLPDGSIDKSFSFEFGFHNNLASNKKDGIKCLYIHNNYLYIGGVFDTINGQSKNHIARINLTDNKVDNTWSPDIELTYNGSINTIAADDDYVYFGGLFFSTGKKSISHLARADINDGIIDEDWSPNPSTSVNSILIDNNSLFVGGRFSTIDGVNAGYVVKIDKNTGELDETWQPDTDRGRVSVLKIHGDFLYVGGEHYRDMEGTVPNSNLGRISISDGTTDDTWLPEVSGRTKSIFIKNNDIYIGGDIGFSIDYINQVILKLNDTDGSVDPNWDPPNLAINTNTITSINNELFVGGEFIIKDGFFTKGMMRVDKETMEIDLDWLPEIYDEEEDYISPYYIYPFGDDIFTLLGGGLGFKDEKNIKNRFSYQKKSPFSILKNYSKESEPTIKKYDKLTGEENTDWSENLSGYFHSIIGHEDYLYLGGEFTEIDGHDISFLARVDITTGIVDSDWNHNLDTFVTDLKIYDEFLYVAGAYTEIGGEEISFLSRISLETGELDSDWAPFGDIKPEEHGEEGVLYIIGNDNYIFSYGEVFYFDKDEFANFAKISKETADICDEWNPSVEGIIFSMEKYKSDILFSGFLIQYDIFQVDYIVRVNDITGSRVTGFSPDFSIHYSTLEVNMPWVMSIINDDDILYTGGLFSHVNQKPYSGFAVFGFILPEIISQPENTSTYEGGDASFEVKVYSEAGPPSYQWEIKTDGNDWENIEGANNRTLEITNATIESDGNIYRCVVHDRNGSVVSEEATLSIVNAYNITFNITDNDENIINNAIVTFGDITNDPNDYEFENIMEGFYSYSVEKEGYFTFYEENYEVTGDATILVVLEVDDTSIKADYKQDIKIYPNPAYNEINILSKKDVNRIEILNLNGSKTLYKNHVTGNHHTVKLENFESGAYIIHIYADYKVYKQKIIVIK